MKICPWTRLCFTLLMSTGPALQADPLGAPRKRVTIQEFKVHGALNTAGWTHVGTGMADMITKALVKSNRCVVVKEEPALALPDEEAAGTGLPAASLVLMGTVSEFSVKRRDVNPGAPGQALPSADALGIERETARCVLDVRFIDTVTGLVIASDHIVGEEAAYHGHADEDAQPARDVGAGDFDDTLIGKATRKAAGRAAALVEKNLARVPWYGRIVQAKPGHFLIDTGFSDNRHAGEEFEVLRAGEPVFDLNTGDILGAKMTSVGRIRVVAIVGTERSRAITIDGSTPQAGDIIQK